MMDDVFCKIISGNLEKAIYQDDDVVVVNDISPSAPVHMLVIPRKHYTSIEDFSESDAQLIGKMLLVARKVARDAGLSENGYRITMNTGAHGGQAVPHFHIHVLGGKALGGKMVAD